MATFDLRATPGLVELQPDRITIEKLLLIMLQPKTNHTLGSQKPMCKFAQECFPTEPVGMCEVFCRNILHEQLHYQLSECLKLYNVDMFLLSPTEDYRGL